MCDRTATELTRGFVVNKAALFAAASVLALCAGNAALARSIPIPAFVGSTAGKAQPRLESTKAHTLYNQNSNDSGVGLVSMNFTSDFYTYDSYEADDFVVAKGRTWKVGEVDVTGVYINGSGPSNYEDIYFYKNAIGMPGEVVSGGTFTNLSCTDNSGSFSCVLPKRVVLKGGKQGGHYWVSVVANMDFAGGAGEWGWEGNNTIHYDQAHWENPNGGFGICRTWGTNDTCLGFTQDDMFDLKGTSK